MPRDTLGYYVRVKSCQELLWAVAAFEAAVMREPVRAVAALEAAVMREPVGDVAALMVM